MFYSRLTLLALLAGGLLLSGCDSFSGTDLDHGAASVTTAAEASARDGRRFALASVCVRTGFGSFQKRNVLRRDLPTHLARGAELPDIGALDASCRSRVQRVTCPCFTARELAEPFAESHPDPHLYFDTFNWYGLDYRRTEVRSIVQADGLAVEEVASVYITPGTPERHALMCHRASVHPDSDQGIDYRYVTKEPTVAEAEVCRRILDAFAGELDCLGPACDLAYSEEQLDPNYEAYTDWRPQASINSQLQHATEQMQSFADQTPDESRRFVVERTYY
jgi:hypothetical protein